VIRPPQFKSPADLAKSVLDDANDFSSFYLSLLAHRNPGLPLLTLAGTFGALGYFGARSASLSVPVARSVAFFAFRRAITLSVYTAPVTVPYYIGRNVAHAIDPKYGQDRFHYAIMNPIAAATETGVNLTRFVAQSRYGSSTRGGGGF